MSGSRTSKYLEGAGFGMLGQLFSAAVGFFLTPFVVHRLGNEAYALYALFGVLVSFTVPLSLGAGHAVIRFIGQAHASKDDAAAWAAFRASALLHFAGPALAAAAVLLLREPLVGRFLSVPPGLVEPALWVAAGAGVGAVAYNLAQHGIGVLCAHHRFGPANLAMSFLASAPLAGSAVLVAAGHGLKAVAVWTPAAFAAAAVFAWAAAVRGMPRVPRAAAAPAAAPFLAYGALSALQNLLWLTGFQLEKLLIGHLLPLSMLTYYAIPFSLVQKIAVLPAALSYPLVALASRESGPGAADALRRMYLRSTRVVLFATLPVIVLLGAFAPQFLTLWLGVDFSDRGTWPLRILLLGAPAWFVMLTAQHLALGAGRPGLPVGWLAVSAVAAPVLWAFWIPRWGLAGAAAGFAAAQWLAMPLMLFVVNRRMLGVGWGRYLGEVWLPPGLAALALAVPAYLLHFHLETWLRLAAAVAVCSGVYGAAVWLNLDAEERALLRRARKEGPPPEPAEDAPERSLP